MNRTIQNLKNMRQAYVTIATDNQTLVPLPLDVSNVRACEVWLNGLQYRTPDHYSFDALGNVSFVQPLLSGDIVRFVWSRP